MKRDWGYNEPGRFYLKNRIILPLILYGVSAFFAVLCFLGFLKYFRPFLPILLIFITFFGISYILGAEPRRLLPSYPYVFSFGILFIIDILQKFQAFRQRQSGNIANSIK